MMGNAILKLVLFQFYILIWIKMANFKSAVLFLNIIPIRNDIKTFDNIRKNLTGQGDDYTTGFC